MNKGILIVVLMVIALLIGGGVWMATKGPVSSSVPPAVQQVDTMGQAVPVTNSAVQTPAPVASGKVIEVEIVASDYKFTPTKIEAKKGDTIKIVLSSTGSKPHDFVIDEFEVATSQLGEGEEEEVEFVVDKTGTFEFYCSVGNHRAMGMTGTLVVN